MAWKEWKHRWGRISFLAMIWQIVDVIHLRSRFGNWKSSQAFHAPQPTKEGTTMKVICWWMRSKSEREGFSECRRMNVAWVEIQTEVSFPSRNSLWLKCFEKKISGSRQLFIDFRLKGKKCENNGTLGRNVFAGRGRWIPYLGCCSSCYRNETTKTLFCLCLFTESFRSEVKKLSREENKKNSRTLTPRGSYTEGGMMAFGLW